MRESGKSHSSGAMKVKKPKDSSCFCNWNRVEAQRVRRTGSSKDVLDAELGHFSTCRDKWNSQDKLELTSASSFPTLNHLQKELRLFCTASCGPGKKTKADLVGVNWLLLHATTGEPQHQRNVCEL